MEALLKRFVVGVAIGLAAFVGTRQALATEGQQDQAGQAPVISIARGELLSVDSARHSFVIKTSSGDMDFVYNDQTKVSGAQHGIAGLATVAGSPVIVEYRTEGNVDIATSIEVHMPQPPPAIRTPQR